MILQDKFKVGDSFKSGPRGIVELRDSNGNLLFRKENTIVDNGRLAILKSFTEPDTHYTFNRVIFGENSSATTPSAKNLVSPFDGNSFSAMPVKMIVDDTIKALTFNISINGENLNANKNHLGALSELGLTIVKGTNVSSDQATNNSNDPTSEELLFSRVAFDTIAITAGTTFSLTYYIYF